MVQSINPVVIHSGSYGDSVENYFKQNDFNSLAHLVTILLCVRLNESK